MHAASAASAAAYVLPQRLQLFRQYAPQKMNDCSRLRGAGQSYCMFVVVPSREKWQDFKWQMRRRMG